MLVFVFSSSSLLFFSLSFFVNTLRRLTTAGKGVGGLLFWRAAEEGQPGARAVAMFGVRSDTFPSPQHPIITWLALPPPRCAYTRGFEKSQPRNLAQRVSAVATKRNSLHCFILVKNNTDFSAKKRRPTTVYALHSLCFPYLRSQTLLLRPALQTRHRDPPTRLAG